MRKMSALTYYLSCKRRCILVSCTVPLLVIMIVPFTSLPALGAAEKPTPVPPPQAVQAKDTVNSSPVPTVAEPVPAPEEVTAEEVAAEEALEERNPLPVSTSDSAAYLKTFDTANKRDPFAEIGNTETAFVEDTSWWDEAAKDTEEADPEAQKPPDELHFDGRNKPDHASFARLPNIKVTGLMQVDGRRAVSAIIQNKGSVILFEGDNVVIDGARANLTKWLTIKKIHINQLTVVLDDGKEIKGKFY